MISFKLASFCVPSLYSEKVMQNHSNVEELSGLHVVTCYHLWIVRIDESSLHLPLGIGLCPISNH